MGHHHVEAGVGRGDLLDAAVEELGAHVVTCAPTFEAREQAAAKLVADTGADLAVPVASRRPRHGAAWP